MYLLMLLATFVSAIYGYNLSARPDYDRDVPRKKAMGLVYKFVFHTQTVSDLMVRMGSQYNTLPALGFMGIQPNDLIYADFDTSDGEAKDNKGTSLAYKQGSTTRYFLLREKDNNNQDNPVFYPVAGVEVRNWLQTGRILSDGSEMMTKVVCLADDAKMSAEVTQCQSTRDAEGNLTDSCCVGTSNRFLISYRKFDVRFVNRINLSINMDFWNAINERKYTDNIGVIQWKNNKWLFQGRMCFSPVYEEEKRVYEEEHKDDADPLTRYFPASMKNQTYWTLPTKIFDGNYFVDKNGHDLCKASGCLFQIRYF